MNTKQKLICPCWWCNSNGVNVGTAFLICICGCWYDKTNQMKLHSEEQTYCLKSTGFGCNCNKWGFVCCAPQWLQNYSKSLASALV